MAKKKKGKFCSECGRSLTEEPPMWNGLKHAACATWWILLSAILLIVLAKQLGWA